MALAKQTACLHREGHLVEMSQQRKGKKRNSAELLDKILKDGQTGASAGQNSHFMPQTVT